MAARKDKITSLQKRGKVEEPRGFSTFLGFFERRQPRKRKITNPAILVSGFGFGCFQYFSPTFLLLRFQVLLVLSNSSMASSTGVPGRKRSVMWEYCHVKDPDGPKPKFHVQTIMVCNYCTKEMMKKAERWATHFKKCPGDVPVEARHLWEDYQDRASRVGVKNEHKTYSAGVMPMIKTLCAPETVTINGEEVVVQRGLCISFSSSFIF